MTNKPTRKTQFTENHNQNDKDDNEGLAERHKRASPGEKEAFEASEARPQARAQGSGRLPSRVGELLSGGRQGLLGRRAAAAVRGLGAGMPRLIAGGLYSANPVSLADSSQPGRAKISFLACQSPSPLMKSVLFSKPPTDSEFEFSRWYFTGNSKICRVRPSMVSQNRKF